MLVDNFVWANESDGSETMKMHVNENKWRKPTFLRHYYYLAEA